MLLVHVKDHEGSSLHQQKLLSPTEKTAPETPHQWPHLHFCDFVISHYLTMSQIYIIYA